MKNIFAIIIVLALVVVGVILLKGHGASNKMEDSMHKSDVGDMNDNTSSDSGSINTNVNVSTDVTVGAVKEFTVSGQNFSFSPNTITVNKGDKVKIIFKNTQGFHDFVIDEFSAKSKQGQSPFEDVLEFTADKVGSFEYYCSVGSHRAMGMKGTLTVK